MKVGLDLDADTGVATIRIEGPPGVWFGVGFGATVMSEAPYSIILDGSDDILVEERTLGMYDMGNLLTDGSLQKVSQESISEGMVAVELQRALAAAGEGFYTFDPTADSIEIMVAVGRTPVFGHHISKAVGSLKLTQPVIGFVQGH